MEQKMKPQIPGLDESFKQYMEQGVGPDWETMDPDRVFLGKCAFAAGASCIIQTLALPSKDKRYTAEEVREALLAFAKDVQELKFSIPLVTEIIVAQRRMMRDASKRN